MPTHSIEPSSLFDVLFYIVATLLLTSAMVAVVARRVRWGVLGLMVTGVGIGGMYVLLAADLVAVVQLLLFAGGTAFLYRLALKRAGFSHEMFHNEPARGVRGFAGLLAAVAVASLLLLIVWTVPEWREVVPNGELGHEVGFGAVAGALAGDAVLPALVSLLAIPLSIVAVTMILRADARPSEQGSKKV